MLFRKFLLGLVHEGRLDLGWAPVELAGGVGPGGGAGGRADG